MRSSGIVLLFLLAGSIAAGCSKGSSSGSGSKAKAADELDGMQAYDGDGKSQACAPPESDCEERKEAALAFKDACGLAGFRIQLCGCEELCTGNVTGKRNGYDSKNKKKECELPKEGCEAPETRAAFQDGCSEAGFQLIECGCEWLCSGKLKEPIPDPPAEEEKKDDDKDGDKKDGDKKDGDKKDGDKKKK